MSINSENHGKKDARKGWYHNESTITDVCHVYTLVDLRSQDKIQEGMIVLRKVTNLPEKNRCDSSFHASLIINISYAQRWSNLWLSRYWLSIWSQHVWLHDCTLCIFNAFHSGYFMRWTNGGNALLAACCHALGVHDRKPSRPYCSLLMRYVREISALYSQQFRLQIVHVNTTGHWRANRRTPRNFVNYICIRSAISM